MADKRTILVQTRIDDAMKDHIDEYIRTVAKEMPGISVSVSEAMRVLVERGYAAWHADQKRKRSRIS